MPTIETCGLTQTPSLDRALQHPSYDWIAFTSRTGIQALWQRMEQLGLDPMTLQHSQICAIGKDADYLRSLGMDLNLIPSEPSPGGIVNALAQVPGIETQSILVPAPIVEGVPEPNVIPDFVAGLNHLGLTVMQVPTYLTRRLDADLYTVELDLIRQGRVDAIALSSTAEISALLQMIDAQTLMQHCVIGCFGPYTAANAEDLGLSVDIVATDFSSFTGFAEAMARFFQALAATSLGRTL